MASVPHARLVLTSRAAIARRGRSSPASYPGAPSCRPAIRWKAPARTTSARAALATPRTWPHRPTTAGLAYDAPGGVRVRKFPSSLRKTRPSCPWSPSAKPRRSPTPACASTSAAHSLESGAPPPAPPPPPPWASAAVGGPGAGASWASCASWAAAVRGPGPTEAGESRAPVVGPSVRPRASTTAASVRPVGRAWLIGLIRPPP